LDEEKLIFAIQKTINSAEVIPGWYNYHSLTYLICLITALTHFPAASGADWSETVQKLSQYVDSTSFTHLLRAVFAVLTASTALFAVLAARAVRAGSLSAAVSAAIVLASFEVFYHARWIAPDPLLMLAGAMTLASALWAARDQRLPVLLLSATCAGLATAAKYPGGCLLLLPLIVAARGPSFSSRAVCVLAAFIATYLLVTPGTIVDPLRFVRDVHSEMEHYRSIGHDAYTVAAGWQHLSGMLDYLSFRLVSPFPALSVLVIATALAGAAIIWRRDKRSALLLTLIPLLYVAYMATNRVMIIRNLLLIMPFIAVLVGVAVDALARLVRPGIARTAIPLAVVALLALNWPSFFHATTSLRDADPEAWRKSIQAYIVVHSDRRFAASPQVAALLSSPPEGSSVSIHPPESADAYLFMLGEHADAYTSQLFPRRLVNSRNLYRVVAGPDDVDLDYYANWSGLKRVIAVDAPVAGLLTGLPFSDK
jgi:hypothetical protein